MKIGSLFTGIGGIELGLQAAGVDVDLVWWAENDEALSVIRLPGVDYDANLGDVRGIVRWEDTGLESVDMLTAGFPCQPVSSAGGKRVEGDPRWLWPEVLRATIALRPQYLLCENVRNLVYINNGHTWDQIGKDLTDLGYGVRYVILGACHVGCCHHRHRVFFLATPQDKPTVEKVNYPFCGIKARFEALSTPTANGYGYNQGGQSDDGVLRPSLDAVAQLEDWGRYERGIMRQEFVYGDAPIPTVSGRGDVLHVSVEFVEWLMCFPPGHVSGRLPRTKALQALGNAVCPPQMAEAWRILSQ